MFRQERRPGTQVMIGSKMWGKGVAQVEGGGGGLENFGHNIWIKQIYR